MQRTLPSPSASPPRAPLSICPHVFSWNQTTEGRHLGDEGARNTSGNLICMFTNKKPNMYNSFNIWYNTLWGTQLHTKCSAINNSMGAKRADKNTVRPDSEHIIYCSCCFFTAVYKLRTCLRGRTSRIRQQQWPWIEWISFYHPGKQVTPHRLLTNSEIEKRD